MTRTQRACWAASVLAAVVGVGGCHLSKHTTVIQEPTVVTTITQSSTPTPVKTIYRNYRTYDAGQTGQLGSPSQRASLEITAGKPSFSTTRLSSGYGYPPQNGHYVTFPLRIVNTGHVPILIQRLDFYVQTPGVAKTTTNEGNSPVSGSPTQLDTTQLTPGHKVVNNLTFDVAHTTGTLFYAPGGKRALAWRF